MSMATAVTGKNFQTEVMESTIPVLVDFWAEWCMPCKMMEPVLAELATTYKDKVLVVKVNIEEEPELADQFGITSIPTMLLFKNGQIAVTKIGAAPKHVIEDLIKKAL